MGSITGGGDVCLGFRLGAPDPIGSNPGCGSPVNFQNLAGTIVSIVKLCCKLGEVKSGSDWSFKSLDLLCESRVI